MEQEKIREVLDGFIGHKTTDLLNRQIITALIEARLADAVQCAPVGETGVRVSVTKGHERQEFTLMAVTPNVNIV